MKRLRDRELLLAIAAEAGKLRKECLGARTHKELAPFPRRHDRRPILLAIVAKAPPRAGGNVLWNLVDRAETGRAPLPDKFRPAVCEVAHRALSSAPPPSAFVGCGGARPAVMARQ